MKKYALKKIVLLTATCFCGPVFALPITYDFTGTVSNGGGIFSSIATGTTITGKYTFDFGSATYITGAIGSPDWRVGNYGGAAWGTVPPVSSVFTTTAYMGGISYSTLTPQPYVSTSALLVMNGNTFNGLEERGADPNWRDESAMVWITSSYSANGLPNFLPGESGWGYFNSGSYRDQLQYTLTSVVLTPTAPIPEPETYAMMLAGLGLLGFMARRKKST